MCGNCKKVSEKRAKNWAENQAIGGGFGDDFKGCKSYYKIEPVVENGISFYKIEFPLKTKWDSASDRVTEKVGEKVGEKVTENQKQIIEQIIQNRSISIKELSEKVGIAEKNIEVNLFKLKKNGLLKRIGPDKGGHWEVVK